MINTIIYLLHRILPNNSPLPFPSSTDDLRFSVGCSSNLWGGFFCLLPLTSVVSLKVPEI